MRVILIAELDEHTHVLNLRRRCKVGERIVETVFSNIALTAQAEALLKRAIAAGASDSDCWLLATGTECTDSAFRQVKRSQYKPYINL